MCGKSSKSKVISLRLPTEVYTIIQKRINGRRGYHDSVAGYVKDRIIYDTLRKHGEHKKK